MVEYHRVENQLEGSWNQSPFSFSTTTSCDLISLTSDNPKMQCQSHESVVRPQCAMKKNFEKRTHGFMEFLSSYLLKPSTPSNDRRQTRHSFSITSPFKSFIIYLHLICWPPTLLSWLLYNFPPSFQPNISAVHPTLPWGDTLQSLSLTVSKLSIPPTDRRAAELGRWGEAVIAHSDRKDRDVKWGWMRIISEEELSEAGCWWWWTLILMINLNHIAAKQHVSSTSSYSISWCCLHFSFHGWNLQVALLNWHKLCDRAGLCKENQGTCILSFEISLKRIRSVEIRRSWRVLQ